MSNPDVFYKNLERWSILSPGDAEKVRNLDCQHYFFSKTESGVVNLVSEIAGEKIPLYSEDPLQEAQRWFDALDLRTYNILYVYGVGLGYYYEAAKEWLKEPHHFLIFLENDLEIIHRLLETEQGARLLSNKQVRLVYFDEKDTSDKAWISMARLFFSSPFKLSVIESYAKRSEDLLLYIHAKLAFWGSVYQNISNEYVNYGKHFFVNYYQSLLLLPEAYQGNALFKKFKGLPAIICGAGPSLDKNIALLETLKDRALIFAGGTAMNAVNSRGIVPHFGSGIDPNEGHRSRIIMNTAYEVPFFYRGRMHFGALELVHGPKLYVTGSGGYGASDWFEKGLGIEGENIEEGFNVVNFSLSLAYALGCNPIIFVGLDLAYSGRQSYQSGVASHPTHGHTHDFKTKAPHEELLIKIGVTGAPVYTLWKWIAESLWLGNFVLGHENVLVINATEGGIGIPTVPNKPLSEVAQHLLGRQFDLRVHVHGEVENSRMPKDLTLDKVKGVGEEMIESLSKSIRLSQAIYQGIEKAITQFKEGDDIPKDFMTEDVLEKKELLSKESAYIHILKNFEEGFMYRHSLEQQQIAYDPDTSPYTKAVLRARLTVSLYKFFQEVAEHNIAFIKVMILYKIENKKSYPKISYVTPKPRAGEIYSFNEFKLKLVDPELEISYEEQSPSASEANAVHINYPEGNVKLEQFYVDGVLHGPVTFFDSQGKILAQSWYIHGKQQGKAKYYYASGELYAIERYRDGKSEGAQQYYYPDGCLKTELHYNQGKLDGDVFLFHPNGRVERELHFVKGLRHGKERLWNEDSLPVFETEYHLDQPVGFTRIWYPNGKLAQEFIYDSKSRMIGTRRWDEQGLLIPEQKMPGGDYFDTITQQTTLLTASLDNVVKQLNKSASLLTPKDVDVKENIEKLEKSIEQLHAINKELLFESGMQQENPNEPIWKTPEAQRHLQKQLEEITKKLKKDIENMQEIFKDIARRKQEKKPIGGEPPQTKNE